MGLVAVAVAKDGLHHFAVLNHLQLPQAVERGELHVQFQGKRFAGVCSENGGSGDGKK